MPGYIQVSRFGALSPAKENLHYSSMGIRLILSICKIEVGHIILLIGQRTIFLASYWGLAYSLLYYSLRGNDSESQEMLIIAIISHTNW